MQLEQDIIERIDQDFAHGDNTRAIEMLLESGETGRVARCIVVAAKGMIESLKDNIKLAQSDFRDAVIAGEYDGAMRRVRDLSVSFLIDAPEKMWISAMAAALDNWGYILTSIETRTATVGPFQHTSDHNEGVADFAGPAGSIAIEKRDRKWCLLTHGDDIELYRVNRLFEDEAEFRDAVSSYLLAKQRPSTALNQNSGDV